MGTYGHKVEGAVKTTANVRDVNVKGKLVPE